MWRGWAKAHDDSFLLTGSGPSASGLRDDQVSALPEFLSLTLSKEGHGAHCKSEFSQQKNGETSLPGLPRDCRVKDRTPLCRLRSDQSADPLPFPRRSPWDNGNSGGAVHACWLLMRRVRRENARSSPVLSVRFCTNGQTSDSLRSSMSRLVDRSRDGLHRPAGPRYRHRSGLTWRRDLR